MLYHLREDNPHKGLRSGISQNLRRFILPPWDGPDSSPEDLAEVGRIVNGKCRDTGCEPVKAKAKDIVRPVHKKEQLQHERRSPEDQLIDLNRNRDYLIFASPK